MRKQKNGLVVPSIEDTDALMYLNDMYKLLDSTPPPHQSVMNEISDRLLIYLGSDSQIYKSLSLIDISQPGSEDVRKQRRENARQLLLSGQNSVSKFGIHENLKDQLTRLEIKEKQNKLKYSILGAIGGALLAEGVKFLFSLLSQK